MSREHLDQPLEVARAAAARRRSAGSSRRRGRRTSARRARSPRTSAARVRQERIVAAEDLLRHAVDAAEVAAVGDRDAQVAQRPAARVDRRRRPASDDGARARAHRAAASASACIGKRNDRGSWSRRNGSRAAVRSQAPACGCMIGPLAFAIRRHAANPCMPLRFPVDVIMERHAARQSLGRAKSGGRVAVEPLAAPPRSTPLARSRRRRAGASAVALPRAFDRAASDGGRGLLPESDLAGRRACS